MTRIISGFAGSRELKVPSKGTRPTSDRVREAIFSALDSADALTDARVLDLFAGSGALGLEALSRGASHVTLVERDAKAAQIARSNAATVSSAGGGNAGTVDTVAMSVLTFLDRPRRDVDVVFIDPPYDTPNSDVEAVLVALTPHLNAGAIVIVERSARDAKLTVPPEYTLDRTKTYGETAISYLSVS